MPRCSHLYCPLLTNCFAHYSPILDHHVASRTLQIAIVNKDPSKVDSASLGTRPGGFITESEFGSTLPISISLDGMSNGVNNQEKQYAYMFQPDISKLWVETNDVSVDVPAVYNASEWKKIEDQKQAQYPSSGLLSKFPQDIVPRSLYETPVLRKKCRSGQNAPYVYCTPTDAAYTCGCQESLTTINTYQMPLKDGNSGTNGKPSNGVNNELACSEKTCAAKHSGTCKYTNGVEQCPMPICTEDEGCRSANDINNDINNNDNNDNNNKNNNNNNNNNNNDPAPCTVEVFYPQRYYASPSYTSYENAKSLNEHLWDSQSKTNVEIQNQEPVFGGGTGLDGTTSSDTEQRLKALEATGDRFPSVALLFSDLETNPSVGIKVDVTVQSWFTNRLGSSWSDIYQLVKVLSGFTKTEECQMKQNDFQNNFYYSNSNNNNDDSGSQERFTFTSYVPSMFLYGNKGAGGFTNGYYESPSEVNSVNFILNYLSNSVLKTISKDDSQGIEGKSFIYPCRVG